MLRRLWSIHKHQKGFTLIEVLVATAITGLIGVGITGAIFQVINVNALTGNHLVVVKQVENAVYWINRDAQMAQVIQTSGGSGFPVSFSWVEWDNTSHKVSYFLQNNQLRRSNSVNGEEPSSMLVAEYINANPDKTNCQFANGVLTFKMTASVTGFRPASETRIIEVMPRPAP